MAIIKLGKIDKNLIPIIVSCVISFLSWLLTKIEDSKLFSHPILVNIISAFPKLFVVIPIIKDKISSYKKKQQKSSNNIELIYTDPKIDVTKGRGKYLILSSTIYFIQGIIVIYTNNIKSKNSWIWDILILSLLYYLVFKSKLYLHHYLSIILIILTGIILDLVTGNLQEDIKNNFPFFLLRFLRQILYSSCNIINKYLLYKKYSSVYEITLFNGIINLILLGIFYIINYYYLDIDNFGQYFSDFSVLEFFICLGLVVTQFGLYIGTLVTNKNNTPCHIFIISVFGQFANYLNFSSYSIAAFISLIFIFFMTLVFIEVIEINLWGLDKNTKRNIASRAEKEPSGIDLINITDENEEHEENDIDEKDKNNNSNSFYD